MILGFLGNLYFMRIEKEERIFYESLFEIDHGFWGELFEYFFLDFCWRG